MRKKHRITKQVNRRLQELSRLNYKRPFYRQTGNFVGIEGLEYKAHLENAGHELPEGFNEVNVYPVPEVDDFKYTKGVLYKELRKVFVASGSEGVVNFINDLRQRQEQYEHQNTDTAE